MFCELMLVKTCSFKMYRKCIQEQSLPFTSFCQKFLEKSTGPNFCFPSRICLGQTRMHHLPKETGPTQMVVDMSPCLRIQQMTVQSSYYPMQALSKKIISVFSSWFINYSSFGKEILTSLHLLQGPIQ